MLRVIDCLTLEHDLTLVLLAALLCALGCVASVLVAARALDGRRPTLWAAQAGLCFGATAWSTHFVAMLAWRTSVPISYDPVLTLLSLLVGIALVGGGFVIALQGQRRGALPMRLVGGAVVGGGVSALHYIGMAGLRFPGTLAYERGLLLSSVVLAVAFGAAALVVVFGPARRGARALGVVLLMLLAVSLHFVGMGAVVLELGFVGSDAGAGTGFGVDRSVLIGGVTVVSLAVLAIGVAAALVDQRFADRRRAELERLQTLADGAFEGLITHRDHVLVDANRAARTLLGLGEGDVAGLPLEGDWSNGERLRLADDGSRTEEVDLPGMDGRSFPAEIRRRPIRLADGGAGELIAIRDLSARRRSEARIAHLALHDPLTDLPNRRFFTDLCDDTLARARRDGEPFAVFVLDLDDFKLVNDLHGHAAGDELIGVVASRIAGVARADDVVARVGGDEFALIDRSPRQPASALELAARLRSVLDEPVRLQDVVVRADASIGVAVYPEDGEDIESLLRNADTAMYCAKADGKGASRRFETRMNVELENRRRIESRLRAALEKGALSVFYQPLVRSLDRAPTCFEALLRWHDESLGQVSPAEFIPVAETTGLIVSIGEFVLRRACADAASWPGEVSVAVNLSVAQFAHGELVETVRAALEESGLPGERLEIEVTESLLIDDRERAQRLLDEMRAMGVRVAMDDFGTGYSSLGYLQSFAFDKLKIDRVFVAGLEDDPQSASIVRAVVAMGRSLGMKVVAEGVETDAQARLLTSLDCDEMQGFLVARPMPTGEAARFLGATGAAEDEPPSLGRAA